jgi:hypothetical protein
MFKAYSIEPGHANSSADATVTPGIELSHGASAALVGQRFSSCCKTKPQPLSGFIRPRDPHRQVFVCGVEVKATLRCFGIAAHELENRSNPFKTPISHQRRSLNVCQSGFSACDLCSS